jgi:hypothetical protein
LNPQRNYFNGRFVAGVQPATNRPLGYKHAQLSRKKSTTGLQITSKPTVFHQHPLLGELGKHWGKKWL